MADIINFRSSKSIVIDLNGNFKTEHSIRNIGELHELEAFLHALKDAETSGTRQRPESFSSMYAMLLNELRGSMPISYVEIRSKFNNKTKELTFSFKVVSNAKEHANNN